jgi:5-deoxy-glucuronate isomerase
VTWNGGRPHTLGPREHVFASYPHAVYLPAGTSFTVDAVAATEIADCRAASTRAGSPRVVSPEDCGFEIRGGGNATRQIVDILPPAFPADRLMICEVYTPGGNWSSYPPHKHDRHQPPTEADLEETYYYRFSVPGGYGIQRLYRSDDRADRALRVTDGDLVIVRDGYHPFVAAPGADAYYLNTLAGSFRSMAATDDPRYAHLRSSWPAPDQRVPMIHRPSA